MRWVVVAMMTAAMMLAGTIVAQQAALPGFAKPSQGLVGDGKRLLAEKKFAAAKNIFAGEVKLHPGNVEDELGLADTELGLHQYEAAELGYRQVVSAQPEMWQAHKNLVIVEAALGRWEEFDRERALLKSARERGAPGISARESDVIDSFVVPAAHGHAAQRWIVREYFQPVGRTLTRYNFERFSAEGKVEEYISLESEEAAKAVTAGGAVTIGEEGAAVAPSAGYALNWYTGKGHGTVATYAVEPEYEKARAAVMGWLRR